jgi:hypothetical protein
MDAEMKIDKATHNIKLSKGNINSVAYSEYFAKSGIKLVMGMIIVALVSQICRIFLDMVPLIFVNLIFGGLFIWLLSLYTLKQKKYHKALWQDLKDIGAVMDIDD